MSTEINIKKRIDIQEEGVSITPDVNSINFVGSGVTASSTGNDVTVNISGGSGTTTYYLNQTVNQAPYKEFSSIPTAAAEQTIVTSVASGATVTVQSFQTPSGVPGTTNIPGGLWSFYLHFSGTTTDTWSIFTEVYKRDLGGVETLLLTTDAVPTSTLTGTATMILTDGVFPASTLLTTDRIVVKVRVTNTDSTTNSITFHTEGSTNYSVGLTTLNQIVPTGAVTSVTGTAPVVSSGGTTPAISMPAANGSTNGYLTSADWTAFNSKVSSNIYTADGTLTGDRTVNLNNNDLTFTDGGAATARFQVNIDDGTNAVVIDAANSFGVSLTASSSGGSGSVNVSTSGVNINGLYNLPQISGSTGQVLTRTSGSNTTWSTPASSSGVFGIANTSGVYTYYATLTLAMAAATAGQTIEMFADVTESGATTITLKNNVTINGNGHTYTHTSTTGNTFNFVSGATVYINNLIINRTVTTPTGAAVFYFDNSFGAPMRLRCSAVYVNYTFTSSVGATPVVNADGLTQYIVEGLNATANGSGAMFSQNGQPITIIDCFARNTATGNGYSLSASSTIDDSYASVISGTGIALAAGSSARNCNAIATTGIGISGGSAYQSNAFSNTNYAFNGTSAYNCVAQTTSGTAFYNCIIRNCSGTSTTGAALAAFFSPAYAYNSSLQSTGGVTIPSSPWSMLLENCSITNEWNNASGHAVTFGSSGSSITNDITNCKITVSNASANCLNVASAINAKYANNVFKGATTPVNANITQTVINTQDNQGNILM